MAMKDALGGWSGGGAMHAQCWTPARWVASLPDTGAWTVGGNCLIAQVRYTLYTNGAALSAVRFVLIHYRKPSRQPGYLRLHLVGFAAISFCKQVTCLQRKHG